MPELAPSPAQQPSIEEQQPNHYIRDEGAIKDLLGVDYEYAQDSGLIDMFHFDPETGEDAILHILSGDIRSEDGHIVPGGFHHEPSSLSPDTYVDRSHIASRNAKGKRDFREWAYNPYQAITRVEGFLKTGSKVDEGTGRVKPAINAMFPKEYDPLAVLQVIKTGVKTRNTTEDVLIGDKIENVTEVPLLDGQNRMKLRLILDADTSQVITAYPIVRRGDHIKYGPDEVKEHLGVK